MSTTTDGRSTRWDEHRLTRRKELVESTLRAIREHGASVGMDDIAAAAGTSKTVFYRHFADRSGLFNAVAEHVDALIFRNLTKALGAADQDLIDVEESPRALISAAIDSYLQLVEKDPEVYRFIVNAPLLDAPSMGDPAVRVTNHISDQIAAVIRGALLESGQDTAAADVWGPGVVGMVRAAADQWLASPTRTTRAGLTQHLTDLAWSGLSTAWPHPRPSKETS